MNFRDPNTFEFNDEENETINKNMSEITPQLIDINDNLATDRIQVPKQHFALISIVSKNMHQQSDKTCLKIRGVFNTIDEANQHAQRITQCDPTFDVLVVSMYEWLLIPPDLDKIDDQVYTDKQLNDLISEYRIVQERTRMQFDIRKEALKKNTVQSITDVQEET